MKAVGFGVKNKNMLLGRGFLQSIFPPSYKAIFCLLSSLFPSYHIFRDRESHNHYRNYQDYRQSRESLPRRIKHCGSHRTASVSTSPLSRQPCNPSTELGRDYFLLSASTIQPFQHRQDSPMSASLLLSLQIKTRSVLCYHTFGADVP